MMRVKQIEREISSKVFIGGYESVQPKVRLIADLDQGEDVFQATEALNAMVSSMWVDALHEDIQAAIKLRKATSTVWSDDRTGTIANAIPALKE